MTARKMLYLIDGHSLAYRHHFAFINNPLINSTGLVTNAIYGFARAMMDLLEKDKPDYLAVTFDDGLSGRDTWFEEYKGTRDQMPDDLTAQMPHIMRLVQAFNMPILMLSGYEADDVIGTVATQAVNEGVDVRIVSGDGDILQLLSPNISVQLRVRRKDGGAKFVVRDIIYDSDIFKVEYGFEPPLLVDYKALKGDTSDNIPGVPGIGDKTATTLLQEYGTIENIYEHIDLIKGANQKKLLEGKESAFLSKRLATIQRDVPVSVNLNACVAHDYEKRAVEDLFREFEFGSTLLKQLDRLTLTVPAAGEQMSMFAQAETEPEPAPAVVETIIVQDEEALAALVDVLNQAKGITFDLESTSVDQMAADMVGIALAVDGERGYYIPVGHNEGQQLPLETVIEALRPALTNPSIEKYAHNAHYDLVIMQRAGLNVTPISFDTMVGEWLRDPASNFLGLKALVRKRYNINMTEITELIGTGKKQITMADVGYERAAPYAAADAALTHRLVPDIRAVLNEENVLRISNEIEMPLVPVIAAIERVGVVLDIDYLSQLSSKLDLRMKALEAQIYALDNVGEFNLNSPKQLNEILFTKLGLRAEGVRKTTHGFSTAVDVLENLKGEHPIIDGIMEYRELSKLKGTYVDALPALVNKRTGRVHTSYNQTGSATGRMSSNNPNLQNIPIRTELGREVRRAFLAPPGTKLLSVDYSQVELRIMAHFSEDQTLLSAFEEGQDIHATTAAVVYNIPIEKVTKEQRIFAKRVNFGVLYGMGAFRLARDSDLTRQEAEAFIKTYFDRLPGVRDYLETTKQKARDLGYVETLFGRKRRFPELMSKSKINFNIVQRAEREAINMPVQGTAADIMKIAMINLYDSLRERGLSGRMILQVHDELVLEVPERELKETAALVVHEMENVIELKAPLRANAQAGDNWRDVEPVV